jgi:hypothetical protein
VQTLLICRYSSLERVVVSQEWAQPMQCMGRCVSGIERRWHCRGVADTFAVVNGKIRTQFVAAWQKAYSVAIRKQMGK